MNSYFTSDRDFSEFIDEMFGRNYACFVVRWRGVKWNLQRGFCPSVHNANIGTTTVLGL